MVNFAGLEFIFGFLPIFLVIYYITPKKYRDTILLVGSLFFYAVGEPVFFLLFILLTGINYFLAGKVAGNKRGMLAAVILDVAVLAVFKGLNFYTESILLPMGISFYLFKMISWQADVYAGRIKEKKHFQTVMLYFSLFPQVISGPIMRYEEGNFTKRRRYTLWQFEEGLEYFVMGLGMKVLLADRLSILWRDLQMIGFESISTPLAWFGMIGYSLQLYFDFWGYSLMASGIMVMLGFDFIENFHHPYAARSISEFYRKWHMTLGRFFKDYVYIPMGGSRCSKGKVVFNLALVWLLTGIWHGNGLNFVIWGIVLGTLIIAEKLLYGEALSKMPVLGNLYVLLFIPLSWVIFAITDLRQLMVYFGRLFPFLGMEGIAVNTQDIVKYSQTYGLLFAIGILLCIPTVFELIKKHRRNPVIALLLAAVFWYSVHFLISNQSNPFMYFSF